MLAFKSLCTLFAAATAVSAYVVPRTTPPSGWWTEGLEDYDTYHDRYLALGCQNYHGQEFFDLCCHPLKVRSFFFFSKLVESVPDGPLTLITER